MTGTPRSPARPPREQVAWATGVSRATRQLLTGDPAVDGIFAANDLMAQGALLVLEELGRRIPGDVAVVGFDDSSVALACRPPLTAVRQPVEDMAAEMAGLRLTLMDHPGHAPPSVIFEPELVIRASA